MPLNAVPIAVRQADELNKLLELLDSLGSAELRADLTKALSAIGKFEGIVLDQVFPPPKLPTGSAATAVKKAAPKRAAGRAGGKIGSRGKTSTKRAKKATPRKTSGRRAPRSGCA